MSKFYDFKSKVHFTKFRELDEFIQNSLDKFFFVEPWKNLYDNTGIFSKHIISNKSTIPDLIIFNKTFNKNDCYEGANRNYFNKFPRLRFILRPRYKEFYNPCDTIGNDDNIFIRNKNYNKEKKLNEKNNKNNNNDNIYFKNTNSNSKNKYIKPLKKYIPEGDFEDGIILSKLSPDNIFETNINSNNFKNNDNKKNNDLKNEDYSIKNDNKLNNNNNLNFNFNNNNPIIVENKKISINENKTNQKQYDDEEEPEWENDDVTNYTTKIAFQEIPKDLKEKAEKEIDKRGKVDVYNDKVLQTLNEGNSNINNNNNNNNLNVNNNNSNEEILKFDESKGGNIFEQLENFLQLNDKNTNEKENDNNNFFDSYNNNNNNNKSNSNFNKNNNNNNVNNNLPFSSFNRNKRKNNYIYNNNNNNNMNINNINQNLQMQNMQLRYQIQQQQAQQAQLQQLYFLQQQQYLNYIQMQNIQNQMMNGIYGNIPNNNQRNPMINMNMNMNFSLNNNNNQNIKNLDNNINNNVNNEENEEEDPMMNDFTTDNKYYNPTVFLENPALIVKKNLIEKNWFLMRDGKILGNYNSEELLFLLDEKIKEGNNFNNISINDYQTDVVFQPKILYEILKEYVPKIKKKYLESKFLSHNNDNINSTIPPFGGLGGNNVNQLYH